MQQVRRYESDMYQVRRYASGLSTAGNIHEWGTLYYLKEAIDNPLDVGSRFYGDCDGWRLFE